MVWLALCVRRCCPPGVLNYETEEVIVVDLMTCCPIVTVIAAYRPPEDDKAVDNIVGF